MARELTNKGRLYLRPYLFNSTEKKGQCFAGSTLFFRQVEVIRWIVGQSAISKTYDLQDFIHELSDNPLYDSLKRPFFHLQKPRNFAGFDCSRPLLMGILNVTPDSFYDGGYYKTVDQAVNKAVSLKASGADIIDIGGESTRPGAESVAPETEIERIIPVVQELANRGLIISVDTRHADVMQAAINHGAAIINDISALTGDRKSLSIIVSNPKVSVILMHMKGQPTTMQHQPFYDAAALEVFDYLHNRLATCYEAGIAPDRLCVDPGIGFGKNIKHNLDIIRQISLLHTLGVPVLLGASRKRLIADLSNQEKVDQRLPGSLAICLHAINQGVQILRVHDVAETKQAYRVWSGINI